MRITRVLAAGAALLAVAGLATPAHAQTAARIHLLHGIPATDVDVEVGGSNVFTAFKFGEKKDLSSLAGTTLKGLKVKLAGTTTVAIDAGDVALPASGNYSIVANLDAAGKPTLSVFENDTTKIAAGKGRLVVRHTAAAPAVDVRANKAVAFAGVVNGKEGKADLAVGTISADVVAAGTTTPSVIGPVDVAIKDGESVIVYAVGSLEGKSLTVLTESITGLGTNPVTVQTGNSPINDGGSDTGVLVALAAFVVLGSAGVVLVGARRHSA